MHYFEQSSSVQGVKARYHQLAKACHPDVGGSDLLMQQINQAYQMALSRLSRLKCSLKDLEPGDTVYVNGTECNVLLVTDKQFVARAAGRTKQAWFDRESGIGIHEPQYRARVSLF